MTELKEKKKSTALSVRNMVVTALMSAMATVLELLNFSVPFMPGFIKFDFSELPALIASFALGPSYGVVVCLVKNIVNLLQTTTGGIGELSNFILGASFVLIAGLVYKHKKTRMGAFIGSVAGAVCMSVIGVFSNYFVVYPIYTKMMPLEVIIKMYHDILPLVDNLLEALLVFNMPFTFLKGMVNVLITFVIYKHIAPIIKGKAKNV